MDSADAASKKAKPAGPVQTQNVHVLDSADVPKRSHKAQKRRRWWTFTSFVFLVVFPMAAVIYYYTTIATDRYAVETKFSIRSVSGSAPADFLGIMSSVSTVTSTLTDSYLVVEFIESRDLVDRLNKRLDLAAMYDRPGADVLTRLDGGSSIEGIVKYMRRMISVYFDTSSQIITMEVQAFTPEDAESIAVAILDICDDLINEISERARLDTMRSAEKEVARVESQLDDHRKALTAFRQSQQDIDPAASAGAQIQLLGQLEIELAGLRARLNSLQSFLNDDAPSVRILKSKISATEQQLADQRGRLGTGAIGVGGDLVSDSGSNSQTLTARVGIYEDLAVDLEFLQQAYITALASRVAARLEADRAQRYLAAFVKPTTPQRPTYPKRVQNIMIFGAFIVMLWGIGVMLVYVVREHSS